MKSLDSVILMPVPDAEFVVKHLREKYDSVATRGIPAHITELFPFYRPDEITNETISKLDKLFSLIPPITFSLNSIETFPNVIFLEPNPRESFIDITKKIYGIFPDKPPYEGKYPEINPHLTIAQLNQDQDFNNIKREILNVVTSKLPINTVVSEAWLMIENQSHNWTTMKKFPFKKLT